VLVLDSAQGLAYYDHLFFGKYPAITRNRFGKGTLTYEGTVLSDKLQDNVMLDVLQVAGLAGPGQAVPPSVRINHGPNRSGKTIHYYLNYSSNPQTLGYAYGGGTDRLTQTSIAHSQQITLKPWDLAIIEGK
jgi:beta-galactosidase